MHMKTRDKFHRLIRALVFWAVLTGVTVLVLKGLSVQAGFTCANEWIALCALFVMNLLGPVVGPIFLSKRERSTK